MSPTRFFLTNLNPPPESPVIPPQNHSASVNNNCSNIMSSPKHHSDGDSSSGLYSPCSSSPFFMNRNANNNPLSNQLSSANTSDDESVSSWPLSRPPSLSQFDIEDGGDFIASLNFGRRYEIDTSSDERGEIDFGGELSEQQQQQREPQEPSINTTSATTSTSTSTSLPQLVMPRVTLPSRKPFTAAGLKLGKLKILIAGDSGIGKTELIKAILESSKHIVHVDHSSQYTPKDENNDNYNHPLVEVCASTKPYPLYLIAHHEKKTHHKNKPDEQPTADDSTPRRKPSLIHSLESATSSTATLARNISFVDTPGYGQFNDTTICINTVLSYLDNKFRETANTVNVSSPQVINLLTSASSLNEFNHVDVCFYLILDRIKPVDVNYISELSRFAPVIPLIAKSDQLQAEDIIDLKVNILKELKQANVSPFLYDTSIEEAILYGEKLIKERRSSTSSISTTDNNNNDADADADDNHLESIYPLLMPCAISSHRSPDPMLASVLMEPDYTIELIKSELDDLCRYIFSEHGSAWLRFIAAEKFVEWISTVQVSNSLYNHSILQTTSTSITRTNYHQQQLIPYSLNNEQTRTTTSPSSIEILPEFFTSTPNGRAQLHYARWAMQLEQVSRTENVIALRSRQTYRLRRRTNNNNNNNNLINRRADSNNNSTNANTNNGNSNNASNTAATSTSRSSAHRITGPTSPTRPEGNISESILNCDPLSLDKLISKAVKYTVGAITLMTTAKLVTWLYKTFATTPAPVVQVLVEPKPHENIFMAALNSLGGGWSVLV